MKAVLYKCDPEKNTECKKRSCKYNAAALVRVCMATNNAAFAMLDDRGKPIRLKKKDHKEREA